ncbi:hypothetical protein D3C72_1215660 [compost metagenome]
MGPVYASGCAATGRMAPAALPFPGVHKGYCGRRAPHALDSSLLVIFVICLFSLRTDSPWPAAHPNSFPKRRRTIPSSSPRSTCTAAATRFRPSSMRSNCSACSAMARAITLPMARRCSRRAAAASACWSYCPDGSASSAMKCWDRHRCCAKWTLVTSLPRWRNCRAAPPSSTAAPSVTWNCSTSVRNPCAH